MAINNFPQNIFNVSFKYLWFDNPCKDDGQFFAYTLIPESLSKSTVNTIVFKIKNMYKYETYDVKILKIKDNFFLISDYLDNTDNLYKLDFFQNENEIILYKSFKDGELYIHLVYAIKDFKSNCLDNKINGYLSACYSL